MTNASETLAPPAARPAPALESAGLTSPVALLRLTYPWVVLGAFGLYWLTFLMLEAHNGSSSFGANSVLYTGIAYGNVQDRLTRFHPATVGLARLWMEMVSPFFAWVSPHHLLAALFAAFGAMGAGAALAAFETLVPRRYVLICGLIYASSFGIWYFSSIAEFENPHCLARDPLHRPLSASARAMELARRARADGGARGGLRQRERLGLSPRHPGHRHAGPARPRSSRRLMDRGPCADRARRSVSASGDGEQRAEPDTFNPESGSAVSMFWFYADVSDHSLDSLYAFILNWLFFNISAPTTGAYAAVPIWPAYVGYFEPSFANYFDNLVSIGLIGIGAGMVLSLLVPVWRPERSLSGGLVLALVAYILVRGAFFFVFNPAEVMLFTSAVTLPVLVLLLAPFAASRFPIKGPCPHRVRRAVVRQQSPVHARLERRAINLQHSLRP